ncbi:MAG TPA: ATP-dependent zinc metalloprotease FtsH [Actinomycetes bacterium]|nr:ATP-dependent zinc metalloprotease FtsH [Actinomycetes bacterium]
MKLNRLFRGPVTYLLLILVLVFLFFNFLSGGKQASPPKLSEVVDAIEADRVQEATLEDRDQRITGKYKNGERFEASYTSNQGQSLFNLLRDKDVPVQVSNKGNNVFLTILVNFLPFVLILLLFFFLMQQMQGGGNRVMSFGKAKARLVSKDQPKVTFADVAGVDEAVEELQEIKEFLESPAKFQAMGAKIPKGVLLFGPPGTGKTLLARAVAGEAGVPFFSISGSDFVEMFVGVGASRVRDLFEQAKSNAPAIVFVDEIDAVGRQRGAGLGGGHDEREQTLNQLLVEMDGFDVKSGVILIAATNRPDILDPALLRPGRFDRQITVDRPDLKGRHDILKVHARGKPMASDVDLEVLARRTPGFTGADLANVVNEAALLSARHNRKEIADEELEEAIDRVIAGPERKTRVISEREKRMIAYHESGHAIVGHALPNADPVHKVSVISRGRALGWTLALPVEDKFLVTRSEMIDELAMLLGGRVAEELWFLDPTTGASNDIERATQIARKMVCEYGMSDRLGALVLGTKQENVFLGRDFGHQQDYSDQIAFEIDKEVRRLIDEAHEEAEQVLTTYRDVADEMVEQLMEKETIGKEELARVLSPVIKRPPRGMIAEAAHHVQSNGQPRDQAGVSGVQDATAAD